MIFALSAVVVVGCAHRPVPPPGCEPTYHQYHHPAFRWGQVNRVLVLPFGNESPYTRADDEIARAFRAELQQFGRFEVVAAPPDDAARLARDIHTGGRFNEETMLVLARNFNADVVIHGTVTEYSPYPRPRVGLVIQAVAPAEGKVVSSVDGLWDSNNLPIAKRAQTYWIQRKHERGPLIEANVIFPDDGHADELALLSPQLYQRWVSSEVVAMLVQDPAIDGVIFAPHGTRALTPRKRPEGTPPFGAQHPPMQELLPGPQASPAPGSTPEPPKSMPPAKDAQPGLVNSNRLRYNPSP